MAYMSKGVVPGGPYPNKAGEWCGNHLPGEKVYAMPSMHEGQGMTQAEAEANEKERLSRMRFGRPRPAMGKTTAELEALGHVGCYLKEDASWSLNPETEVSCPTPPAMTEPVADIERETDDRAR